MKQVFLIASLNSNRYFAGIKESTQKPQFFHLDGCAKDSEQIIQFDEYRVAEIIVNQLEVPVGTRLTIEKHYLKQ